MLQVTAKNPLKYDGYDDAILLDINVSLLEVEFN